MIKRMHGKKKKQEIKKGEIFFSQHFELQLSSEYLHCTLKTVTLQLAFV